MSDELFNDGPLETSGDGDGRSAEVYYCPLNSEFDEQKRWGVCNGGCFEEDKRKFLITIRLVYKLRDCMSTIFSYSFSHFLFSIFLGPKDFSGDPVSATFCKIRKTDCVFPFIYKGETHNSCIKREDSFWCATKVNEDDSEVIVGFWGKCNVDEGKTNCDPNWTPPEAQTDTKTMGKCFKK